MITLSSLALPGARRQSDTSERSRFEVILQRIRGEFLEMPGLGLTEAQAMRLWSLDAATCRRALGDLCASGFVTLTAGGVYRRRGDV